MSPPESVRPELREWVAYLRDLGVREIAADAFPAALVPASAPAPDSRGPGARNRPPAPRGPGRPAARRPIGTDSACDPAPGAAKRQLSLSDTPFDVPPPGDRSARLVEIQSDLGQCTRCKLHTTRTKIVFGVGNPQARLMFVGEGPGEHEDRQGEPFVGRAGQKLDEMIQAIGLQRADVYIANVVKCRPPGNRDPEPDEIDTCSPFLMHQIEAIRPAVIVTLGGPATKLLLGTKVGITRLRGKWQSFRGIPVMPTFHPAYVLRNYTVQTRKQVWEDLKAARTRTDG